MFTPRVRLLVGEFFPGEVSGGVFERNPAALAIVGDAERQTIPLQLEVADVVLADLSGFPALLASGIRPV